MMSGSQTAKTAEKKVDG